MLEYKTFSIWLYNDNDEILDNDVPPEWLNDKELEDAFMAVSELYDTFFIDTPKEFSYIGPRSINDTLKLKNLAHTAMQLLYTKNNGKDIIQNDLEMLRVI